MNTYIALFRGINVGGHHKLPMKELRTLLEGLGYQNVQTYIQTGNVVFQTDEKNTQAISKKMSEIIKKNYGFKPDVLILTKKEMKGAVESNPFPEGEPSPKSLHLMFLISEPSDPDFESLVHIKRESERFELIGKVFYLYAPEGIGRSKLAGKTERLIGVSMTGRNWRTVQKIMEMVEEY